MDRPDKGGKIFIRRNSDGGGGEYLVIHAKHWAMDGKNEIVELVKVLTTMLAK